MSAFIYTATRKLATGHTLNDSYEILIDGETIDPQHISRRTSLEALDLTEEFEFFGIEDMWFFVTDLITDGQNAENFREFIASTAAGEQFTFDPDQTVAATPVSPVSVYMKSTRHRRSRPHPSHFRYSLQMREI